MEILVMRSENEKRIQEYVEASDRDQQYQRYLQVKNKETDQESRRQRMNQLENIYYKRREDVTEMQQERKQITKAMLKEQERDLHLKQKKADEIKKREEAFRLKKEAERRENERRIREENERKAAAEEAEARKAEKLVKALEKKEREWMSKLKESQVLQESAFVQLETALQTDVLGFPGAGMGPGANGGGLAGGMATFGSGGGLSGGDSDDGLPRSVGGSYASGNANVSANGKKPVGPSGRVVAKGAAELPAQQRGRVVSKSGSGRAPSTDGAKKRADSRSSR
jgi:membrane protein involved in colicin uptake